MESELACALSLTVRGVVQYSMWLYGGGGVNQSSILEILSVNCSAFPPDYSKSHHSIWEVSPFLLSFVFSRAVPIEA